MIISLPVHTAVWFDRPSGALVVSVAVQLFVEGSYLPPVFKLLCESKLKPPHTIISLPVHTAVCPSRARGAPVVPTTAQVFVAGSYRPPVFKSSNPSVPPQTII